MRASTAAGRWVASWNSAAERAWPTQRPALERQPHGGELRVAEAQHGFRRREQPASHRPARYRGAVSSAQCAVPHLRLCRAHDLPDDRGPDGIPQARVPEPRDPPQRAERPSQLGYVSRRRRGQEEHARLGADRRRVLAAPDHRTAIGPSQSVVTAPGAHSADERPAVGWCPGRVVCHHGGAAAHPPILPQEK
jgi:hypothetical protein